MEAYFDRVNQILENFEAHKREIGLIDLDNYEESMDKIVSIGRKINDDKTDISEIITKIIQSNDNAKKTGNKNIAKACLATAGCILGTIITGGAIAAIWGGAALVNGIGLTIKCANSANLKKQEKLNEEIIAKAYQKYEEMELELANLRNMFSRIQVRYIPPIFNDNHEN